MADNIRDLYNQYFNNGRQPTQPTQPSPPVITFPYTKGFFTSHFKTLYFKIDKKKNERIFVKPIGQLINNKSPFVMLPRNNYLEPVIFNYSFEHEAILAGYKIVNTNNIVLLLKIKNIKPDEELVNDINYYNSIGGIAGFNFNNTIFDRDNIFLERSIAHPRNAAIGQMTKDELIIEIGSAQNPPTGSIERRKGEAAYFVEQFKNQFQFAPIIEDAGAASGNIFERTWDKIKTGAGTIITILALLIAFVVISWFFRRN